MTGCRERREEILRHAGGELPGPAAGRLWRHLETCPDCRAALEEARALEALLRRPAIEAPGVGFPGRVLGAVERVERERLALRIGEIARARGRLISRRDLLPAVLLGTAALLAGLFLLPETVSVTRLLLAAAGSASAEEWGRAVMAFLGARGSSFNPTYLYPPVALISLAFGLANVLGPGMPSSLRSLLPSPGDR